ncbi:MAG: metallophosphoesterase family protein [Flavobacteriales bacterium]|nr:metallophosphoesterase family protein [Flavobacteriales bacterium]
MRRIAYITDVHLDEQFPIDNNVNPKQNLEIVLQDISKQGVNEIIFGGDIGEASSHIYFFDALKPFTFKLVLGNHDKFKNVKDHFIIDKSKNELYYKVEDENYLYLFLDTSTDEISNSQLLWLQSELKINKKILVFIHHPILPINTPVDNQYPLKNREELKSILLHQKNNITVFCGHYHMNDEFELENIKQITTQSLSFQLVKNADKIQIDNLNFGYRIIEIHEDKIETHLINFKN